MAQSVSIGTAYGEAAAFVRREKTLLAPLVLALMVVPVMISQLVQPTNPFERGDGDRSWLIVAAVAVMVGLIGQMAVSRLAMGSDRSLGQTIGHALRRAPPVFGAFLMFGLGLGIVLFAVILMATLVFGSGDAKAVPGGLQALSVLLALALVPRILLLPAIAMDEPIGAWGLLKRAWSASREHYLRLFGFFVMFIIASQVLVLATTVVVGSLATLIVGTPEPLSVSRLIVALAVALVQGVAGTLYAAMIGRIVTQLPASSTSGT